MPPGRRHRRIHHRRDRALEDRALGRPAVLGVVVRPLDVVEVGADVDGAPVLGAGLAARQRAEARQLGQRHVDLERGALIIDPAHRRDELGRKRSRIEETGEGHAGIGIAGHHGSAALLAARQRHAGDAAVPREDARYLGLAADLDAEVPRGAAERLAEATHAAPNVAPDAALAVGLAHDVMEEHVAGPGRRGARHGADDRVGGQRRLQLGRFEPAVEDGAGRTREELDGLRGRGPQPPERAPQRHETKNVPETRAQEVRWNHGERRLDESRHALEHGLVLGIAGSVARAELRDLAVVERRVRPQEKKAPVRVWREGRGIARQDREAVVGEAQVARDVLVEETVDIGGGGDLESGKRLLGNAGPAHQVPALENEHAETRPRQVACRDQAIVTRADDNRVVAPRPSSHDCIIHRRARSSRLAPALKRGRDSMGRRRRSGGARCG